MNVLSLFDGLSASKVALDRSKIKIKNYFASEIDIHAINVSQKNYPDIKHIGDVVLIEGKSLPKIDLLIGGSPCQDLSIAGKKEGLNGERSKLFYHFLRLKNEIKPKYFLLENVASMTDENKDIISNLMGIEPLMINSNLLSAQNRERYYWTNIQKIKQPDDKKIFLRDILEENVLQCKIGEAVRRRCADSNEDLYNKIIQMMISKGFVLEDFSYNKHIKTNKHLNPKKNQNKSGCLTGGGHSGGNHSDMDMLVFSNNIIRRYSINEYLRLQTLPDNYTDIVSPSQQYKMIANSFTVDVISHILNFI